MGVSPGGSHSRRLRRGYGFLKCNCTSKLALRAPRNDGERGLLRTHPIAMESIGHTMAEMYQRHRAGVDVLRIEDREIVAVLPARQTAASSQPQPSAASGLRSTNTGSEMVSPAGSRYLARRFPLPSTWTMPESAPNIGRSGLAQAYQPWPLLKPARRSSMRGNTGHVVEIGLREAVGIPARSRSSGTAARATCPGPVRAVGMVTAALPRTALRRR